MKTFMKMLAWFGLLVVLPALVLSYSSSWVELSRPGQLGSGIGYFVTMCLGGLGALVALIGGFIARPRYFWIAAIVVGVVYIGSFYGYVIDFRLRELGGLLLMLLPGLALIVAGIVIRNRSKRV